MIVRIGQPLGAGLAARTASCLLGGAGLVAALLVQPPAKANLIINIFEEGSALKVTVQGSLQTLPTDIGDGDCNPPSAANGVLSSINYHTICTGSGPGFDLFDITGPAGFGGTAELLAASQVSGENFWFATSAYPSSSEYNSSIGLPASYRAGSPFFSSATFDNQSLAGNGFTNRGLIGTWTIDGTRDWVQVYVGDPVPAPAPIPIAGAMSAFALSRRLRRRCQNKSNPVP